MSENSDSHTSVGTFYDVSVITRFWSRLKQRQMHVGYWDDEHPFTGDLYEGAVRFTDYMISRTALGKDGLFADIGCGYGIPAITLALEKKCRVHGVTVSRRQQEYAQEQARARGLSDRVSFEVADAHHLPFPEALFDGGWFFESIFHIGHESALREAHRVMKPGAELLIADFIKTGDLTDDESAFLAKELGIRSGLTKDEYPALLEKTGFHLAELTDITAQTLDMEKKWRVHLDLIEKREDPFFETVDEAGYDFMKSFFARLHEIAEKAIGYAVVKAVR